ncbi:helix-turn-helix domain-containing protein [Streptomyces angustmyceticus]|uniref:helix-turn-helix domain-containing protein n=1 Tax=Streptomyces angustmyceticus TaxID=285578 RepID=UPI0021AF8BC3|nr:helix-turn-helix transcriptional regulator [Streptomyces angustmyceticus]
MSTDYQQARVALGVRLRELRISRPGGRLTGPQLAQRLGWTHSKIYKLENGKQTASPEDLRAWVDATEQPQAFAELYGRLKGFESQIRSWRRQLSSGHRPVQENWNSEIARTKIIHSWQESVVEGMLQTAEYARHIFTHYAKLQNSPGDADEAVRARLQRQELLYQPGRTFRIIMWEAALHARLCPPSALASQLDRLTGVIGLDTVELGIVPFSAPLKIPTANGFYVLDDRLAVTEDWHAELWLEDTDSIALYLNVWNTLRESAVYGSEAQNVINRARRALC